MEPATISNAAGSPKPKRSYQRSEVRFPYNHLNDCVAVAHALHHRGGGQANKDLLAALLGYKSANNGAHV